MEMDKCIEGYGLIEGLVWDMNRGFLFSDVFFGGFFVFVVDGFVLIVFEYCCGIGGILIYEKGGFIVSGCNIFYKFFDGGEIVMVLDCDEKNGLVGFNDIMMDLVGWVYVGGLGLSLVFEDGREL